MVRFFCLTLLPCLFLSAAATAFAQNEEPAERPFTRFGIAGQASSIGAGASVSTNLTPQLNLALTGSAANLGHSETAASGIDYTMEIRPRSLTLSAQMFPFVSRRIRPVYFTAGAVLTTHDWVLIHNFVPAGKTFDWNGITYQSSPTDPTRGDAAFGSGRLAYTFGMGFGNMTRGSHRISFPVELGVIALGNPQARAYPAGSVCTPGVANSCRLVLSDPTAQANQLAEAQRIASSHPELQYVPVARVGIAYHFSRLR